MLCTVVSNKFMPALNVISGSLGTEIAAYNEIGAEGAFSGWGASQSWYRPSDVLHHRERQFTSGTFSAQPQQRGFSIQIVTDFAGTDAGYGWFAIGSSVGAPISTSTLDYGFLTLTNFSISPVPEPSTGMMLTGGLLFLVATYRRRRAS